MSIPIQIGQHSLLKHICLEYCTINKKYCPLKQKSQNKNTKGISYSTWNGGSCRYYENANTEQNEDDGNDAGNELGFTRSSCWGDGSGFEYDIYTTNLIGPNSLNETVYDIFSYGITHTPLQLSDWNAWLDKFQYDYRFGRVSDYNAETVLFPNNDNPWMFTEYVFQGTGKFYNKDTGAVEQSDSVVIEPPVYDPQTLQIINADFFTDEQSFGGKYAGLLNKENPNTKQFRKLTNWDIWHPDPTQRQKGIYTANDAGAKLYKVNINVESVKWGEHGNVPPHTLDMTAPKDWFDPTKKAVKLKAVYTMYVGQPIYATNYGSVTWADYRIPYIDESADLTFVSSGDYYSYPVVQRAGIPQSVPQKYQGTHERPTNVSLEQGSYSHGGCGLLYGESGLLYGESGCLKCKILENLKDNKTSQEYIETLTYFKNISGCLHFQEYGGVDKCPHYVASPQFPVLASYVTSKQNTINDDYENFYNMLAVQNAMLFGGIAFNIGGGYLLHQRPDRYDPTSTQVWYDLKYEPVYASNESMQLNNPDYKNFGKGVQIIPETGRFAIDTQSNASPFPGGDTNTFGDINTLSFHRFFSSVMHCATQGNCNETVGSTHEQGFNPAFRSGGNDKCRYHKGSGQAGQGCPYTCVPKRALEFGETMVIVSPILQSIANGFSNITRLGCWNLDSSYSINTNGLWSKKDSHGNTVDGLIFGDRLFKKSQLKQPYSDKNGNPQYSQDYDVITVYVKGSSNNQDNGGWPSNIPSQDNGFTYNEFGSAEYGGAFLRNGNGTSEDYQYELCRFKAKKSKSQITYFDKNANKQKTVTIDVHTIQGIYFWYKPLDDNGNTLKKSSEQHVTDDGLWLCKADTSFVRCSKNSIMIDNDKKFIGGYHPQYKDYGRMGPQFIQETQPDYSERQGQAMGDVGAGQGNYQGMMFNTSQKGYWTDESGMWIVDELSTGVDGNISSDANRNGTSGSGVCISIKKSNTEIDGETGKRKSPKVTNGAVFSNDPYNLVVTTFNASKDKDEYGDIIGRPMILDEESNQPYYAPCIIRNGLALPTMRKAMHCPKCDYYIAHRYSGNVCPWCGTELELIGGDSGEGIKAGGTWPEEKKNKVMKKFFKLKSIGQVQVWGPPGTCVHRNAYFWKSPAKISNGFVSQMKHRLGTSSNGIYTMDSMSPSSEMTLGYPQGIGKFSPITTSISEEDVYNYENTSVNEISPETYMPQLTTNKENVIAPFSPKSDDGLKMVSYDQLRALRNTIEPILAYSNWERLTGKDYPTTRCSYYQRQVQDQNIIYVGRKASVESVVLASVQKTQGYGDAFVQYYSGDMATGSVREYYPPGYTWWYLKQVMGGRDSAGTGGRYHMDNAEGGWGPPGIGAYYPGAGKTLAKCLVFLHGLLPLDKIIKRAYIIVQPSGVKASKDPIGLPWVKTGKTMFHHYHEDVKDHFGDGTIQHLHGSAGYMDIYFDEEGIERKNEKYGQLVVVNGQVETQDDSIYRNWASDNFQKDDGTISFYENNFMNTMENLSAMQDFAFFHHVGTVKNKIMVEKQDEYGNKIQQLVGYGYVDKENEDIISTTLLSGWRYKNQSVGKKDQMKFQYIYTDKDNNIIQNYSETQIWKENTKEQIDEMIDRYTYDVDFVASDGTPQGTISYTFTETKSNLTGSYIPSNAQGITSYFDMSYLNSTGKTYERYSTLSNLQNNWQDEIIFQQGNGNSSAGSYSGSLEESQTGRSARLLDVTELVQRLYQDRIDRDFTCKAGSTLKEASQFFPYDTTKIGGGLAKLDDDIEAVANITSKTIAGMKCVLLSSPYNYPKLNEDNTIPTLLNDGDKYELTQSQATLIINILLPIQISNSNNAMKITFGNDEHNVVIKSGRYTDQDKFFNSIKQAFISAFGEKECEVKKVQGRIVLTSNKTFSIAQVDNNCYRTIGITKGTYIATVNRFLSVSNYSYGYHPSNSNGWKFNVYNGEWQSCILDVCQAPVCMQQRDYRNEMPSSDYSNCKCNENDCPAKTQGAAVAAKSRNKNWDSSSDECYWGHKLDKSQAITKPGDGIMTYTYYPQFDQNPIIKQLQVDLIGQGIFVIQAQNTQNKNWFMVARVEYNEESNKNELVYPQENASLGGGKLTITFPADDSNITRARFFRMKIKARKTMQMFECPCSKVSDYVIDVSGVPESAASTAEFSGINVAIEDVGSAKVISSTVVENYNIRLGLNAPIAQHGSVTFSLPLYSAGFATFNVYGINYLPKKCEYPYLTITDAQDVMFIELNNKQKGYTMEDVPTQILGIQCGNDDESVHMEQVSTRESLQTKEQYFHDPQTNKIYLAPNSDKNDFYPSWMKIRYWAGNGSSVELQAQAAGHGPSYQIEKDAIQKIVSNNLPNNGVTCKMVDVSGNIVDKKPILWTCYNKQPATLDLQIASSGGKLAGFIGKARKSGQFATPQFVGNELADKYEDKGEEFIKLFGNHCERLQGVCKTKVVLTGAPNRIVSGDIVVRAEAKTKKTIDIGDGQKMQVQVLTGGLNVGCFQVYLQPKNRGSASRHTVTYEKPKLLIYTAQSKPMKITK